MSVKRAFAKMGKKSRAAADAKEEKRLKLLNEFGTRVDWFKNDKFLRDLEGDSVDTEILDEELRSLGPGEDHSSCRGKLVRFLESNPLQIVLCVLVLVDAGVVVAEILLDLHAIRGQFSEAESQLDRCLSFIKSQYAEDLSHYGGSNVDAVLTILGEKYPFNVTEVAASSHNVHKRHVLGIPPDVQWRPDTSKQEYPVHLPLDRDPDMAPSPPPPPRPGDVERLPLGYRDRDRFISHAMSLGPPPAGASQAAQSAQSRADAQAGGSRVSHAQDANDLDIYAMSADRRPDSLRTFPSSASGVAGVEYSVASFERFVHLDTSQSREVRASEHSKDVSVVYYNENRTSNKSILDYDKPSKQYTKSMYLIKIAHILHYISIAILGVFVIQVFLKVIGMGCFRKKMEIFDAVIIIASFLMDIVFMDGGVSDNSDEAAALVILFLLWRLLRVINGIMVTAKQRQEFRIKLQKRARRKAEKRIEALDEEKSLKDKEIASLQALCLDKGATENEINVCKPRRRTMAMKNTSTGLSSIASLSLGFTMSMSGAAYGPGSNAESRRQSVDVFSSLGYVPMAKGGSRRTSVTSKSSGDSMPSASSMDKKPDRTNCLLPVPKAPPERIPMESLAEENNVEEDADLEQTLKDDVTILEIEKEIPAPPQSSAKSSEFRQKGRSQHFELNGDAIHVHLDDISETEEQGSQPPQTSSGAPDISHSRGQNIPGGPPGDSTCGAEDSKPSSASASSSSTVPVPPRAAVIAMDIPNGPIAIATTPIDGADLETNNDHIHWFRRRSQDCSAERNGGLDHDWPVRSSSSSSSLSIPNKCHSPGSATRGSPSPKSTSSKS